MPHLSPALFWTLEATLAGGAGHFCLQQGPRPADLLSYLLIAPQPSQFNQFSNYHLDLTAFTGLLADA